MKFVLAVIFVSMVFALTMLDKIANETTRALLGLGACFAPVAGWGLGTYLFP